MAIGLTVLFPEDEDDMDLNMGLDVDIIAVHGLNGTSHNTWTSPQTQKLWLRDFLPTDLKHKARILTFGYDAAAAFSDSVAGIEDHARDLLISLMRRRQDGITQKRPIIFVGHSLGGIVIKQAIIIAHKVNMYNQIYDSTKAVIFFGTPHQGSDLANLGATIARIPSAVAMTPTPELLVSLKQGSPKTSRITVDFIKLLEEGGIKIYNFYETKTMKLYRKLIVSKESALLTPPGETPTWEIQIPVAATHRDMCRFASAKNSTYVTFVDSVKQILRGGIDNAVTNEFYQVPDLVNPHFTGRYDIRQQLTDSLIQNRYTTCTAQQRFVLFGLGGSGKTQICMKFAQDNRDNFWGVFWIDATSLETAHDGFINIARTCKQEQNVDTILKWLAEKEHWLLIIDNADDPDLELAKLFPAGTRGSVLITTRNPDCKQHATAGSCRVDQLSPEDAVTLLFKTALVEDTGIESVIKAGNEIVGILGYLALAIIQAGAVIRQQLCSLEGYSQLYAGHKKELLESSGQHPSSDYQYSIYTTWEISLKKIEDSTDIHVPLAMELLAVFAFMHFDGIDEDIFRLASDNRLDYNSRVTKEDCEEKSIFSSTVLAHMMPDKWNPILFSKALKLLVAFSLVVVDESRRMSIHPMVHAWSRERLSPQKRSVAWLQATAFLATSITLDHKGLTHRGHISPHIDACLTAPEAQDLFLPNAPFVEERMYMADKFASTYINVGRPERALELQTKVLPWKQAVFHPESRIVTHSMVLTAAALHTLSRYKESLELRLMALEITRKYNGDETLEYFLMLHEVALSYQAYGKHERAFTMMTAVCLGFERNFGEADPFTFVPKLHLSSMLCNLGRWKEAAEIQESMLETLTKTFDRTHLLTLQATDYLATSLAALGQKERAEKLRIQLEKDTIAALGEPKAAKVVSSIQHLVGWSIKRSDIRAQRELLEEMCRKHGELHAGTVTCATDLAHAYYRKGSIRNAKKFQSKAVAGMIQLFGEEHPQTIYGQDFLAFIEKLIDVREKIYWWIPNRMMARSV